MRARNKHSTKLCLLINLVILFYIITGNAFISYKFTFPIWNFYFLRTASPLHPIPLTKNNRFFAFLQHHFFQIFYKYSKSIKKTLCTRYIKSHDQDNCVTCLEPLSLDLLHNAYSRSSSIKYLRCPYCSISRHFSLALFWIVKVWNELKGIKWQKVAWQKVAWRKVVHISILVTTATLSIF